MVPRERTAAPPGTVPAGQNTVVATVLLPLFEKQPDSWEAITWLNDGASHGARSFSRYLGDWHARVPEKLRPFVRQIAREFAVQIEGVTARHRLSQMTSSGSK